MTVLVTGGAGYIGSHMILALLDDGEDVVTIDDFSTGRRDAVPLDVTCIEGNLGDSALLAEVFRNHDIEDVLHFAGSTSVPDSVLDPIQYYRNNTMNSLNLLAAMLEARCTRIVFSSTAAVYQPDSKTVVAETDPVSPASPYGASKLMTERILSDLIDTGGLRAGVLRYFNVAGADPAGRAGQSTPNAAHLIKVACEAALGRREKVKIFGTDWRTRDGTGVRDYIHVSDLVAAHMLVLRHLREGGTPLTLNCGYGRGFSVREVLNAVERQSGTKINVIETGRRPGDIGELIAQSDLLREQLDWQPKYEDIDTIVKHALAWERRS